MLEALLEKLGVDPASDQPARQYTIAGTEDTPDEKDIEVKLFATSDPDVFLGQYTDARGDVDWVVRPLEGEE